MKGSKWKILIVAAIAAFCLYRIVAGVLSEVSFAGEGFGFDLRLRRNEVRCAHQGVNSFRIWTRETTLPGFVPLAHPDHEKVPKKSANDGFVHAYPPWHAAFFWFYGWISERLCVSLMSVVFGLCLAFIGCETVRISRERFRPEEVGLASALALALCAYAATQCFFLLNYGVLILAAFLLMNKALEKNRTILAGLAWAVMMIKPQVGLLFVWPLFWHRRYLTIVTAAVVCLAGTVFTSFAVHESPIDLILQIPQIGAPGGSGAVMKKLVCPIVGDGATFMLLGVCFAVTGIATYLMRGNRDFLVGCVPVVLMIPIWTYSQGHDQVILLPAYLLLLERICAMRRWNAMTLCGCAYLATKILTAAWSIMCGLDLFDPTGRGWIYRIAEYASYVVMLAIAALFVRDSRRPAPRSRAPKPSDYFLFNVLIMLSAPFPLIFGVFFRLS